MLREQIAETKQPKTTRRKQAGAKKPKTAAVTDPKVGDRKLVEAAVTAAAAAKTALVQRDEAIRAAVAGGTSARQVALAVGFSHPAVRRSSSARPRAERLTPWSGPERAAVSAPVPLPGSPSAPLRLQG